MNWNYKGTEITSIDQLPQNTLGFIYRIDNINTGKTYFGRKQIKSFTTKKFGKRQVAAMTDKRLKKYEVVEKEMKGWKEYTGSNEELNLHIFQGHKYHKQILRLCQTKKQMTYFENVELFCNGVIESDNYYNQNIMGKFFPKDLIEND